jgi:hypothetical protein
LLKASSYPWSGGVEALFKIDDEEIVLEVSAEDSVIVAIMAAEDAVWKSTLEDLKKILKKDIKTR